jgi:hypothetical protein
MRLVRDVLHVSGPMAFDHRHGISHLTLNYRSRGPLDQVELARLGLRLEAAPDHRGGRRMDSRGGELTAAHHADHEIALLLWPEIPPEAYFVLGDTAYADPALHQRCAAAGRILITPCRGPYPHADDEVEVRRLFHKLRSLAIEHFNEPFKGFFDSHGQVPTKGLSHTRWFALGPSLFINSCCGIALSMAWICELA